jgi:hypothetical protein
MQIAINAAPGCAAIVLRFIPFSLATSVGFRPIVLRVACCVLAFGAHVLRSRRAVTTKKMAAHLINARERHESARMPSYRVGFNAAMQYSASLPNNRRCRCGWPSGMLDDFGRAILIGRLVDTGNQSEIAPVSASGRLHARSDVVRQAQLIENQETLRSKSPTTCTRRR